MSRSMWVSALGALSGIVTVAFGQQAIEDRPSMPLHVAAPVGAPDAPTGAFGGDFGGPRIDPAGGLRLDVSQSALLQPLGLVRGATIDPRTSVAPITDDGVVQYVSQPYSCENGFYSNNNHSGIPYLTFEDFVADGTPLRNVEFYGGTTGNMFADVSTIGIEIWSIQAGGSCGWTYSGLQRAEVFNLGQLDPSFVCNVVGVYPSYRMKATFSSPIALNAGQNYMITIYATLNNANGPAFFWNQSTVSNYNPSTSWSRVDGQYYRCGPDVAFTTNAVGTCFGEACNANAAYFSNYVNNTNPYIVADDFAATTTGDLRQLQFTGGAWDTGVWGGTLLGNIAGFYVEVYTIQADGGSACGSVLTGFLGAYQVPMSSANPMFQCIDQIGMANYQFTVDIPAGQFPLVAGGHYALGVYGIPANPNSPELFCWASTDALYGLSSWSYNINTGNRDVCHAVDQAFCINGARPCLGDFNRSGTVNTQDVLAFLNAWAARQPSADCNGDGVINTQDVLCFLNRWSASC